jgi:hypothetical protein
VTDRSICIVYAALSCAVLAACVPPGRGDTGSADEVGSDQVVIVGRVELVPPLDKGEQRITSMIGSDMVRNKLILLTDDKWRRLRAAPERADYKGRIEAPLEQTFFVRSDNRPFHILLGELWLTVGRTLDKVYFPGGLTVDVRPADKAVYIGTLRYHRNEFFQFTKSEIVDDYERANAEFRKKFGPHTMLRKSLATPVKDKK